MRCGASPSRKRSAACASSRLRIRSLANCSTPSLPRDEVDDDDLAGDEIVVDLRGVVVAGVRRVVALAQGVAGP